MHEYLTSREFTLAASAITAAASALVAVAVSRAGRRSDHVSRLWERRAEAYEFVLCQADRSHEMRADAVWNVGRDDTTVIKVPEPVVDNPELRQARMRLQMYGERNVRRAFERCVATDRQFIMAFIAWRSAAELNVKAHRGDVPAHQAVEGSELVRLRKAVEAANDAADAEQEKLVAVVAEKVGRLPRYERRAWRRLKKPQTG